MNLLPARVTLLLTLCALCLVGFVTAQEPSTMPRAGMATQSLRPYWHVFIAYSIAIVLLLGWVVSISRRLRDVEKRLRD